MKEVTPKVFLLSSTKDPFKTVIRSCRLCYSPLSIEEGRFSLEDDLKLLNRVIVSGHHSVLEHASFTFGIEGVSRVFTHQLVRSRIASYSQQSQRYVEFDQSIPLPHIVPESMKKELDIWEHYEHFIKCNKDMYSLLLSKGIPAEDARFVLPNATETKIIVTMNVRSLRNFFKERLCNRAQWEIRTVAQMMLKLLMQEDNVGHLFKGSGPDCVNGKCQQGGRSCGSPIKGV